MWSASARCSSGAGQPDGNIGPQGTQVTEKAADRNGLLCATTRTEGAKHFLNPTYFGANTLFLYSAQCSATWVEYRNPIERTAYLTVENSSGYRW
jgi:hypothetical protein